MGYMLRVISSSDNWVRPNRGDPPGEFGLVFVVKWKRLGRDGRGERGSAYT
jgi:hypothetical protein